MRRSLHRVLNSALIAFYVYQFTRDIYRTPWTTTVYAFCITFAVLWAIRDEVTD
jgi:hypothetical protein